MKLLIVGGGSDPNTRRIVDEARSAKTEFLFWDTDLPGCLDIAWDFTSPELDLGPHQIQPHAVFFRWNVFGGDAQANLAVHDMIQAYCFAWPQVQILNRFSLSDANNKSFNLRLAREVGFEIPDSIVLSNLQPLTTIPNPTSRIAKPLGGGAHTQLVAELARHEDLLATASPQFIQEKLAGENLRVFSIGRKLFCFHLKTNALDYRDDAQVDVVQVDVPNAIIDATHSLVEKKQFDYCALDFRCREGLNCPVFLEVNSFPMFVCFDDACNRRLSQAMLDTLGVSREAGDNVSHWQPTSASRSC